MRNLLLTVCWLIGIQTGYAQTTYTWNGSSSTDWNNTANWTPAGVPTSTDNITIVTGSNTCALAGNTTVRNIILNSGQLDLNGNTLTVTGPAATFNAGTVLNGTLTVTGVGTVSFGVGPTTLNCQVNIDAATITVRNTTFQGATTITKTGPGNDWSSGGNTFNDVLTVNNTGTGYLLLGNGNPDIFNATATFNNTSANNIYVAYNSTNNIFNGPVEFNNAPSTNNAIYVSSYSEGTVFNNNITVTSTNGQGVLFCNNNSTANASLAAGYTINIGPAGFSAGTLLLKQFIQTAPTPQNITLTGSAILTFGPSSAFGGNLVTSSPSLYLNGAVFSDTANFTKTGPNDNNGSGNNIFNGVLTVTNTGAGHLMMGNNNPDTFNAAATFNNIGSNHMYVAHNSTGHTFNAPVTFNNAPATNHSILVGHNADTTTFNDSIIVTSVSGNGVQFCNGTSTATAWLTAGNTVSIGPAGFSSGTLLFRQFTQIGATAQNFPLTGTARLTFGPTSKFDGDVTAESPSIFLNGCTFNGTTDLTKTGSTGDGNQGGNIFNGVCRITNSGINFWLLGDTKPDIWNNDVILTNKGSERLLLSWGSIGNQFNGDIYINSSDTASGIQFCGGNSTATAILAAGKTILPGVTGLTAGYLYLKQFTQLGNVPLNITGTGSSSVYLGPSSEFNAPVTIIAPDVIPQGATYNAPVVFTKTGGGSNNNGQRQNIFNGTCTINQQSNTGYFMLGYNSNDLFNDDIIVTSTGTSPIYLGRPTGNSAPVLAAGKTIRVGTDGFSAGSLQIRTFTQLGNAPINLDFTGSNTMLSFSDTTLIGGNVTANVPSIWFGNTRFKGKVNVTKTGATNDVCRGANNFEDSLTINNIGSGNITLGNNEADTFYSAVQFNTSGSAYIGAAWNSPGNIFNGNITISSTGTATGIYFGNNTNATATLAAGNTILVGAAGFTSGSLIIRRFTQNGNALVTLPLSGTASLTLGPSAAFGGNMVASTPSLYLNGTVFNGTTDFTKTGTSGDYSSGGNTFNGASTFTNNGSSFILLGNNNPDIWNDDVTFNNNGSERILPCWASTGNQFNGNIYLNSSGSATGIRFCGGNNTATATLAAGKTIQAGTDGLNAGNLILKQFTQLGNEPVNLPMGSAATHIQYGPSSTIGGDLTTSGPGLYFHGCTFNGTVNATKTGTGGDYSNGNNIFNAATTITNAGTGSLFLANGSPDLFNASATFNNTGTANLSVAHNSTGNVFAGETTFNNNPIGNSTIYVSQNSPGTQFNNDVIVTSTNGQGVYFCNSTSASATLAAGNTISIGAAGFSSGTLLLRQFTQTGTTAQNMALAGTSTLQFGPSSNFGGDITSTSPGLLFTSSTFNGVVNSIKTGTVNDQCSGNNTFNAPATFTVTGTGYLLMTNGNPDTYNSDVTFVQTGAGRMYPNYNNNSTYAGNILLTSPAASPIVFGSGSGTATFTGSGAQTIDVTAGTPAPVFTRLVIANTGGGVTINTPVNVSRTMTLTAGLLNTTATNILTMQNTSTTAVGDALSTSYVNGPMRYQKSNSGLTTLNFPIGNGADCRPVALTVNHSNGNTFTYQAQLYNASAATLGYSLPPSVDRVSNVHYYTIARYDASFVNQPTSGLSGNQTIQLFFGENDIVSDGSQLTIVKNTNVTPAAWRDIGGTGAPAYNGVSLLTGSITSTSSPSAFNSFSTFALANIAAGMNLLPVGLLYFDAKTRHSQIDLEWSTSMEVNNSHFTVEKSRDGVNFTAVQRVNTKAPGGNSNNKITYTATDLEPYSGNSYYRLKQTDVNGNNRYSRAVIVSLEKQQTITAYPNPSAGTLYVSGINTSKANLTFGWYDTGGKLVKHQTVPVTNGLARLETSLKNGMYLLKFITDDGSLKMQQIIINR